MRLQDIRVSNILVDFFGCQLVERNKQRRNVRAHRTTRQVAVDESHSAALSYERHIRDIVENDRSIAIIDTNNVRRYVVEIDRIH
jgi:hypothetical protein